MFPECISVFTIQICFVYFSANQLGYTILSSGRCSVSVWGAMSADSLEPLVKIAGSFNASQYCDIIDYFAPLCPGWPVHGRVLHPSTELKPSPHSTSRECTAGGPCGVTAVVTSVRGRPQSHRKCVGDNEDEPQQTK